MSISAYEAIRSLRESSLSRIVGWVRGAAPFGMISAFRDGRSKEQNYQCAMRMQQEIQRAGYGLIEMEGGYTENPGTEQSVDTTEFSYFVPGQFRQGGYDTENRLKDVLLEEGRKYQQDAILYRPFQGQTIFDVKCATGAEKPIGEGLTFQQIESYWSRLFTGKNSKFKKTPKFKFQ